MKLPKFTGTVSIYKSNAYYSAGAPLYPKPKISHLMPSVSFRYGETPTPTPECIPDFCHYYECGTCSDGNRKWCKTKNSNPCCKSIICGDLDLGGGKPTILTGGGGPLGLG